MSARDYVRAGWLLGSWLIFCWCADYGFFLFNVALATWLSATCAVWVWADREYHAKTRAATRTPRTDAGEG